MFTKTLLNTKVNIDNFISNQVEDKCKHQPIISFHSRKLNYHQVSKAKGRENVTIIRSKTRYHHIIEVVEFQSSRFQIPPSSNLTLRLLGEVKPSRGE